MPNYLLAYHAGNQPPPSPEAGAESQARWNKWVAELGDVMVNPGTPLGKSHFVSASGVSDEGANALVGFSVLRAGNVEEALRLAGECPYLEMGTIEVAEMKEM